MPPILAAAIVSAAVPSAIAGTTIVGTLTVGSLLTAGISTGLTFGLQQLLTPDQKKTTRSEQVRARDPNPVRRVAVGRAMLGGSTFVLEAIGGATLVQGYVHCRGPIDAYELWYLDQTAAAIPGGSLGGIAGVAPWLNAVFLQSHLGTVDQAANETLLQYAPGWTAQHQLKGLAYSTQLNISPPKPEKTFQRTFPNGAPGLRVVVRGEHAFDPRTGTEGWTENPAVWIRKVLTDTITDATTGKTWCYVPPSKVDDDLFSAFADVCQQPVTLANGGQEPRYRLGGTYDLREEPKDVLTRMLATCDAELYQTPAGKVGIRGGQWVEPTVTLTDDDFIGFEYQQGNDLLAAFNQLKFNFTDPANDYQTIAGQAWDDDDNQQERGVILTESLDLVMVQSHPQARRLAKIKTHKENPRHRLSSCILKTRGLLLVGEQTVRITLTTIGLDTTFRVTRFKPSDGENLFVTYEADFASLGPEAYAWDPTTEEGTPPIVQNDNAAPSVPLVQNLTLSLLRTKVSDGVYAVRIRATVADPQSMQGGVDISAYWTAVGQYRVHTSDNSAEWQPMTGETQTSVLSDFVDDGQTYEVEVAFSGTGIQTGWVGPVGITVVADQAASGPPTDLTASDASGGQAQVSWTNPGDGNFAATVIYVGTTNFIEDATAFDPVAGAPNQAIVTTNAVGAGTRKVWLRAQNRSGVLSAATGPVTVTVTA